MAPTKRKTKHKPEKNKVWEEVLDLAISYIHDVEDRNTVSLVSRKFYEIDGITRKHVLHRIDQLDLEFRYLKELHLRRLVIHDKHLETLARIRGKDLRSLKISTCEGFSTDGLRHISRYCNQLRTLCLKSYYHNKDWIWLHQLAVNNTVLERLHFVYTICNTEDLTLLAKNCCNSLISLKIGACYLSELGDAFRYAVRLEHFGGNNWDGESELIGFEFPPNMRSLSIQGLALTRCSPILPFLHHIRKLKLVILRLDDECQCLLFKRCPNLEVLDINDVFGDKALQVIGEFCKKLHKLIYDGLVTNTGLLALAKGCTKLEWLEIRLEDNSNEAIKCVGTHLKNLRKFCLRLVNKDVTKNLPLDNGIQEMLIGCPQLEKLDINLCHGGLTDLGLEYIGKYGSNLRSLSLTLRGNSIAGLVKLSQGCPRLEKLKLRGCPYSKQVVASFVFNIPSLRYVWGNNSDFTTLALTRPEF